MNFGIALQAAKGGADIRRHSWPHGTLVQLRRGQHHFPDNEAYPQLLKHIVANLYNQTEVGKPTHAPALWLHDATSADRPWVLYSVPSEDSLAEDWTVAGVS